MESHPCSWIRRLDTVKMTILSKEINRFNVKSNGIFSEKSTLKFIWNLKGPQVAKSILKKENKCGRLTLPDFKPYYQAIIFN